MAGGLMLGNPTPRQNLTEGKVIPGIRWFIYNRGMDIKEFGERMARHKALRPICGPVVAFGLFIIGLA